MVKSEGDSTFTVLVAFGANLAIAVAKTAAAGLSGSASMSAEAAHSWADTGNEIFLLIANRRGGRAADERRPLGYGREVYVWSLLAAVGLFVVGAAVSIWRGVTELMDHGAAGAEDYRLAYLVLAVAFILEGTSLTAGRPPTPARGKQIRCRPPGVRAADVGSDGARGVRRGQRGADRHRHRVPRHPAAPAHRRGAVGRHRFHPGRGPARGGGGRADRPQPPVPHRRAGLPEDPRRTRRAARRFPRGRRGALPSPRIHRTEAAFRHRQRRSGGRYRGVVGRQDAADAREPPRGAALRRRSGADGFRTGRGRQHSPNVRLFAGVSRGFACNNRTLGA